MKSYLNWLPRLMMLAIVFSCQPEINIDLNEDEEKDENDIGNIIDLDVPSVSTAEVVLLGPNEARLGGHVSKDYGSEVTARGIVWSASPQPHLTSANVTVEGKGVGSFSSVLNRLQGGLTYYYRAYATNGAGTAYGLEVSFRTEEAPQANMDLDGKWLSEAGVGVEIKGNTGRFYTYNSSWEQAEAKGLVKIGDIKFKNITKVAANKWNFLSYGIKTTSGLPVAGVWSYDGVITMSGDGKTITTSSNTMIDNESKNAVTTYRRSL